MLRQRPYLTAAGALYFVVVCALSLSQSPSSRLSFIALFFLFLPAGALLVAILRPERWVAALFVGTLAIMWIELACIVWNTQASGGTAELVARLLGLAVGVALTASLTSAAAKRHSEEFSQFTRLSQASGSEWNAERRHD